MPTPSPVTTFRNAEAARPLLALLGILGAASPAAAAPAISEWHRAIIGMILSVFFFGALISIVIGLIWPRAIPFAGGSRLRSTLICLVIALAFFFVPMLFGF